MRHGGCKPLDLYACFLGFKIEDYKDASQAKQFYLFSERKKGPFLKCTECSEYKFLPLIFSPPTFQICESMS